MSITLLTPDAEHLFNLCSFFSPEPIATELFLQPAADIEDPPGLAEFLSSPPRFRAAATQLHRLSLARIDGARDLIQVHLVVQAVTQGRLQLHRIEAFRAYRAAADTIEDTTTPLVAMIEVGRASSPFRAREIARIEDVVEALTGRIVVHGWV